MKLTRREFTAGIILLPASPRGRSKRDPKQEDRNPPLVSPNSPFNRAFDFASLASWLTPNSEFFIRSHFGVPEPARAPVIKVRGWVDRELVFSLDALGRMPSREVPATLECAGNLVGWGGVSNARWTGVS